MVSGLIQEHETDAARPDESYTVLETAVAIAQRSLVTRDFPPSQGSAGDRHCLWLWAHTDAVCPLNSYPAGGCSGAVLEYFPTSHSGITLNNNSGNFYCSYTSHFGSHISTYPFTLLKKISWLSLQTPNQERSIKQSKKYQTLNYFSAAILRSSAEITGRAECQDLPDPTA